MEQQQTKKRPYGAIEVDTERCKGCGLCVVACPMGVVSLTSGMVNSHGYPYAISTENETKHCTGCASCGIVCPDGCITVYRKMVEEAAK